MAADTLENKISGVETEICRPAARSAAFDTAKRAADIILSLAASVIILIPCLVIALLIKAEDGGSVFYAHKRTGMGGKDINVYKFRSMKQDADSMEKYLTPEQMEEFRKEYKLNNDPRTTKIGRILRRTSLDELPQIFINVLFMGNMSLVGPRPVTEEETLIYGDARDALLSVKPGLTGMWAAYADSGSTYESGTRQKMELYYIQNRSLLLDIRIILKTMGTVLRKASRKN